MRANQLTSLPPEETWRPGHLLGPVVLPESESLHVVTARFRSLPTLQGTT